MCGFLDIGNVFDRLRDFSFGDLRETAGIGVRVRTPWFLVRGDYGVVLDPRPGEQRSRFYFSIGQAFWSSLGRRWWLRAKRHLRLQALDHRHRIPSQQPLEDESGTEKAGFAMSSYVIRQAVRLGEAPAPS